MRIFCLLLSTFFIIGTTHAQDIKVLTEHLPPYQIQMNENKIGGFSTEIVRAVLKEAEIQANIEIYPWARAYNMALKDENILIFSIVRSKEREPLFHWVGELREQRYYFYGLKSRKDIKIRSVENAKKYLTGVSRGSFEYEELNKRGFKRLHVITKQTQLIQMLYAERMDLIFGSELSFKSIVKKLEYDFTKIDKLYEIKNIRLPLCMAFSKKTHENIITKFRQAYKSVKSKGVYNKIRNKWF